MKRIIEYANASGLDKDRVGEVLLAALSGGEFECVITEDVLEGAGIEGGDSREAIRKKLSTISSETEGAGILERFHVYATEHEIDGNSDQMTVDVAVRALRVGATQILAWLFDESLS